MRDATRQHIENYAYSEKVSHITLEVAEAGIEKAKGEMEAVLSGAVSIEDIKKRLAGMAIGSTGAEHSFYFCGVCSHIVLEIPQACPVCESGRSRFIASQKEISYFICGICHQIASGAIPDSCSLCGGAENYHSLTPEMIQREDLPVRWTDAADQLLLEIPNEFFREMTRWRIEVDARKKGVSVIDPVFIAAKYQTWSSVSRSTERSLSWDSEAATRLDKIPSFVRGTVIKECESYAREQGIAAVTGSMLDQVTELWAAAMKQHGY
jgi:rubrerythrin